MIQYIKQLLTDNYTFIQNPDVTLIRAYTNEVYLIQTQCAKFVLKRYGLNWRADDEILWELDLLNHLKGKGVKVAVPIKSSRGNYLEVVGDRTVVLFEYALGDKPQSPFSPELYYHFGKSVAEMHQASDDFHSMYKRKPLDLEYLIDRPLSEAKEYIERNEQKEIFWEIVNKTKAKINELSTEGLDWGVCHGDMSLDNVHITEANEFIFYDFDSGGMGWRAGDLQGWAAQSPEYQAKWDNFLKGYREIRDLNDRDIEAAPYLTIAWELWGMGVNLNQRVIKQGDEAINRHIDQLITKMRHIFYKSVVK